MRKEYDFTGAKRAQDIPELAKLQEDIAAGKVRITITAMKEARRGNLETVTLGELQAVLDAAD